ncbi:two-component regulator propeller domain-containing protein [Algoriphagus aquimarinus]|mgnify:CR=1 FL=1|uniref:two-component regulator propeller domain-containing protein n=1 Tax=Algoriphagus aquimarinus TaxID=237018 RepID=UPI0030D93467|tara:strand:+ start:164 stop:3496 length:3333 start_codon:yes stop_codon:yes gene_type:complete
MDVFKILFQLSKANKLVLLTLISVFIVSLPLAKAQSQNIEEKPELKFQRIYEGLINNSILAIAQDKLGFIWVGTYSGLHKYDGLNFQVYSSSTDSISFSSNFIAAIFEDSHNQLWIGTGDGVAKYNRQSDDFTKFNLISANNVYGGEDNFVNTILEDVNGTIWVSSSASGLFFFDPDTQQFLPYEVDDVRLINGMVSGEEGILWIATLRSGLIKLNTSSGKVEYYQNDPSDPHSISSNNLKTVAIDSDGNLWVGARSSGLNRMVEIQGKVSFVRYVHDPENPFSLYNNMIYKLYVDPKGNLWSCNENGGLHLYNKEEDGFYRYLHDPKNPNSLSHNSVWNIFLDSQDKYWVGTAQSGINLADPYSSKFEHYFENSLDAESLNNNIIRDFLEAKNGNIWIATDGGGLNYYDRSKGNFKIYKNDSQNLKSLSSDAVISLNEDEEGRLWVGTWGGGLNILTDEENGEFTRFNQWIKNDTYPIQYVFDVSFDENYIWIAAFDEGLYRYDKKAGKLRLFKYDENDPDGISSNQLLRVFRDSKDNLWVGSHSGLSVIQSKDKEEGKFKVYQPSDLDPNSIPSNSIRQIFEDSNQNIWLATERGLARYISEADNFETINQKNGLPVNEITSIVEDDDGYLWIGTIQGIVKFDPDNMVFTGFDKYDGLQEVEFSRYSVLKTRKGELLFGGLNGFNLFHPDHLKSNPYVPPVYLTDFRLFNQSVDFKSSDSPLQKHITETDSIILSYKENIFTFEFIALNYTHPDRNQYAYILEGFEKDWNYVGSQRNATYTNLNPGTYIFRVKAANNDGVWNEDGASIVLVITPPFWKTTWFIFFCTLFVVGLLIFTYKWRVRAIKTQNRQLENTVKERTTMLDHANMELKSHIKEKDKLLSIIGHDLRNPFISIIGYMELLEEEFEDSQNSEHLENIQYLLNVSRNTHNLLENLLNWAIKETKLFEVKREVIKMSEMIKNASAMVSAQADYKKVILEKSCPEDLFIYADRNMILTVMRNLISNAIKFSNQDSRIEIIVQEKSGEVITSVRDHGAGMDETVLNRLFLKSNIQKTGTLGEIGIGLGLVLCQEIVQKHQGEIWVESSPGKGSTFYFSISRYVCSEEAITH